MVPVLQLLTSAMEVLLALMGATRPCVEVRNHIIHHVHVLSNFHISDCLVNQVQCPGTDMCIQNTKICDGVSDCPNGMDEDLSVCSGKSSSLRHHSFQL